MGDKARDSHSILARWGNLFSQMLNVYWVNDIKQTEIHTSEQLLTQSSASEVEMSIGKLRGYRSPGNDQIPAELIKERSRIICSEIH
jgi:hypothetical protein